jgi:hypothetical protein
MITIRHALLVFPIAFSTFALVACAAFPPASLHQDAGKTLIASEAALDAAVVAADTAVVSKLTTPAQNAAIHALTAPCPTGVPITAATVPLCPVLASKTLAEQAYAASNAATYPQLIAQLGLYAAQLTANHS